MRRAAAVALTTGLALGTAVPAPAQAPFAVKPLPELRNMHGACVAGEYLFVIGGTVTQALTPSASVIAAKVSRDRQVGEWIETTALPENRIYISNSTVARGNTIYVAGGQHVDMVDGKEVKSYSRTVCFGQVDANGAVSEWKISSPMEGVGGVGCAAAVGPRALYVCGGETEDDRILRGLVWTPLDDATGAPGQFVAGPAMPIPLWFHAAIVAGDRLYVAGGRESTELTTSGRVLFCPLDPTGAPGAWVESPQPLVFPVNNFALQAVGGFLVAAGGRSTDNVLSDQIQHARLTPEGTAPWATRSGAIQPVYYAAAAYSPTASAIYLTGGRRTIWVAAMTSDVTCIPLRDQRAVSGQAAGSATAPAPVVATAAPERQPVLEYEAARARARAENLPLVLVCYSSQLPRSVEFRDRVAKSMVPGAAVPAVIGSVDLALNLDLAASLEVFRPPVLVLLSPEGDVLRRSEPFPPESLLDFLNQKPGS